MSRTRELLILVVLVGLGVTVGGATTFSAFAGATTSPGNQIHAGDLQLSSEGAASATFAVGAAQPGVKQSRCVLVRNTGTLAAQVRLYGQTTGDLAPYLDLTVTRGTAASTPAASCASFQPDAGGGTLFDKALSLFPTTADAALVDGSAWAAGEAHAYRLDLVLRSDAGGQGRAATVSFTWEGRTTP
jgi:hypothetical protein